MAKTPAGKCFKAPEIWLPRQGTALEKWAVIACDQYTSQPGYWKEAEALAGDAPSALHCILPEITLGRGDEDARIRSIHEAMRRYLEAGILRSMGEGYMLVERTAQDGTRRGVMTALDLEAYDFSPGSVSAIRPTEGTITERIPPRLKVREGAAFEIPHIMVLIDDPGDSLISALKRRKAEAEKAYDFELMLGGGRVAGWFHKTGSAGAEELENAAQALFDAAAEGSAYPIYIAVGDGNHSLATSKTHYENLKKDHPSAMDSPARWAMAETVNLHDPAVRFHPIHRALFAAGVDLPELLHAALDADTAVKEGSAVTVLYKGEARTIRSAYATIETIRRAEECLTGYVRSHSDTRIDYIHDTKALETMARKGECTAVMMPVIDKAEIFPYIAAHGAMPRKAFSIGHAQDKRYYLEARLVKGI